MLFINYVDRGALPTAAHLVQADLGLSDEQLGLLFSAFFWTYSLVQIPVGWLAERYGAHRVLGIGLAIWAVATLAVGVAHTFPTLLALRLLLGIGESAGFPCVSKLLAALVPVKSLGTANGIVAFAYLFGPAVGTFGGGMLMAHYGWRAAFAVFGGLSLLWLVPWSRVELPPHAVRRSDAETPNLRTLLTQPSLWGTVLGLFSSNYTFYFMLTWLPFYLVRERGFSTVDMARLAGMAYVINALSAVAVGGRPLALAALFVYQILCGAQSPGVYAIPQILAGPRATGRWVGIQNSLGNLAGIVAPAATGFIIAGTHHFTAAFMLAAAVSMLGLIGWLWMLPKLAELRWEAAGGAARAGSAA